MSSPWPVVLKTVAACVLGVVALRFTIGLPEAPKWERVETVWGAPIVAVDRCSSSKYSLYCYVKQEGGEYVERDVTDWPGEILQVGDKIGTRYYIGETYVEKYNVRQGYQLGVYAGRCKRVKPNCIYPGK